MYPPNPKCFFLLPSGKKLLGLCDVREISVWHGVEDKKGKQTPYGFDFGSSAILLPKTSVLFPSPREVLREGRSIRFSFTFQNDTVDGKMGDYGDPITIRFAEKDLSAVK